MKKEPIEIQAAFFEKVWAERNIDAVFDYFDGLAGGLGAAEALDPVGYIEFYNALNSVLSSAKWDILNWHQGPEGKLHLDILLKARARRHDRAVFWRGAGWARYHEGKIVEATNYLDFMDLFRQLGLMPEEAVEAGLAGEEILRIEQVEEVLGTELRRLFWPNFQPLRPDLRLLAPATLRQPSLPTPSELEILFQCANFGMVTTTPTGRILKVNQTFADLVGRNHSLLVGASFQDLLRGKGSVAESKASQAVVAGQRTSYRILLELASLPKPKEVWVSAVSFRQGEKPVLLRSVQQPDLFDDLVVLQEQERERLLRGIDSEVLQPIVELWEWLRQTPFPPDGKDACLELTQELAKDLRKKMKEMQNPILTGATLTDCWPELTLDSSLAEVTQTVALITYRLVQDCQAELGAAVEDLELTVQDGYLSGYLPLETQPDMTELQTSAARCRLVGGFFGWMEEEGCLHFRLPCH